MDSTIGENMDIIFTDAAEQHYQLVNSSVRLRDAVTDKFKTTHQALKFVESLTISSPQTWSLLHKELDHAARNITDKTAIKKYLANALVNKTFFLKKYEGKLSKAVNIHMHSSSGNSETASPGPAFAGNSVTQDFSDSGEGDAANEDVVNRVEPASLEEGSPGAVANSECTTAGCPISMVSGEEVLLLEDAVLPGPMPFVWKRFYRTGHSRDTGLGHGWTHSAGEKLHLDDQTVIISDDEGRQLTFTLPQVKQRSRLINEGMELEYVSVDCFILKDEKNWDKVFTRLGNSPHFRLSQIRHAGYKPRLSGLHAQAEQGYAVNLYYDPHNALIKIEGNWGKSFNLKRDNNGRVAEVSLKNEHTRDIKQIAEYDYDAHGDLVAHRNSTGNGETYHYQNHIFTQRTLVTGFSYYFEWDQYNTAGRCIHNWGDDGIYDYHFEWDPENNASCTTDSRGYTKTYFYNDFGQIEREIDAEGGLHRYEYKNGRKVAYINPQNHTTTYYFNADNQATGYRDALGYTEIVGYFNGNPTQYKNKSGIGWQRKYNARGQLSTHTDPYGKHTQYIYNANGLLSQLIDSFERTTTYHWNDAGQLNKIVDPHGRTQEFVHDVWGQIVERHAYINAPDANGASITSFQYNVTGQIEKVTQPNGDVVQYTYNANNQLVKHTDAQGRETRFDYDGLSQVVKRTHANGHALHYQYDKERNLINLTNENGEHYLFEYDGCERLIKETGFDGRRQHYKYNKAGQLIKHMDAGTVVTEFERDALGQMLSKTSSHIKQTKLSQTNLTNTKLSEQNLKPEKLTQLSRYLYDASGRLIETYNENQYLIFEYDKFGNLLKEQHCDLAPGKTFAFNSIMSSSETIEYSNVWPGIRDGIVLPDGQNIVYHYNVDPELQLSTIELNGETLTHIERDVVGRETQRQQGSLTTYSDYDPMGRLIKQQAVNQTNKQSLIQRDYGYDAYNNLDYLKDGSHETYYVYDAINRLQKTQGTLEEQFDFDPAGNLVSLSEDVTQAEHSPANVKGNRLTMQGDRKFEYDERGNLIKENRGTGGKRVTTFEYNLQNQLIKVSKDKQTTEYKYDSLGRRFQKQDVFGTTRYLWAEDQLVQETRNNIKKTYVYEPYSFKPVALVQDGEVYHYHLDHLGTPRELTNQQGDIVWKVRYKTYGNVALKETEEIENNIRFQGQYFDEESGLHYNRHRYYNPNTGQFISQDPIGLLGGVNNYQYAPNPVGWSDPFGLTCSETVNKYSKTRNMDEEYLAEDLGYAKAWEPFGAEVEYLSETERVNYEVEVINGKVYDNVGQPVDSGVSTNGKVMFVMDPQGRIYMGTQRVMEFHHSSFLAGEPVAAAGELMIIDGNIVSHSRRSGHYKPEQEHHEQFISEMKERGINLSSLTEEPLG